MDYPHIEQLIDKYLAGETSLQEERQLKRFFQQEDLPDHFKVYQDLFRHFGEAREMRMPEHFERDLLVQLDSRRPEPAKEAKIVPLSRILAYAASLLLIGGLFFWLQWQEPATETATVDWEKYEVGSEEEALAETMAALELLAEKLNGGAKKTTDSFKQIEKASVVFD